MSEFILIPQKKFDDLNQKVDLLIEIINKTSGQTVKMNDWIPEKEAQKLLGLKETSMWALRKTRKIAFSKIGAKTFYSLKSIEKLLSKNQE
jgi:hypothetical protein